MRTAPPPASRLGRDPRRRARRRRRLVGRETGRRGLLLAHDGLVLGACPLAALALVGAGAHAPVLLPVWLAVALGGLYATEQYALRPHHDRALELAVAAGALAALGAALLLRPGAPALLALALAWPMAGLALPAGRRLLEAWLTGPRTRERWLIYATPDEAREVHRELAAHPLAGRRAIGLVLSRGELPGPFPLLVLGGPAHLVRAAAEWSADGLVVGRDASPTPLLPLSDVPTLCARLGGRVPVRRVDEGWFAAQAGPRPGPLPALARRAADLSLACLALVALAPAWALVALAVRLEGAPVLDVQPHLGRHGVPFALASFRTVDARGRATRLGRVWRATRLHKLPHLLAVVRGDMALVGPSPHPVALGAELAAYLPHYRRRHLVKPGLTGWAQVRDPFDPPLRAPDRVLGFDLFYVQRRSLRLDAVILVRTLFVGLARATAGRS